MVVNVHSDRNLVYRRLTIFMANHPLPRYLRITLFIFIYNIPLPFYFIFYYGTSLEKPEGTSPFFVRMVQSGPSLYLR